MKTLLSLLAVILVITSCKNGWTDSERTEFINTCANAAAPNMGQDKAKAYCSCMQQKLEVKYPSSAEASKAINAPGAMQTPEMTAMVQACLNGDNTNNNNNGGGVLGGGGNNNNGGGMGGNWSSDDKQKFMNTCLQNALNAGADQQTANAHCNCTLGKIMAKYSSYNEANTKMTTQEVNQMEQDCNANNNGGGGMDNGNGNGGGAVLGGGNNNNTGGAWSNADEQKFMNTCIQNATNAGADQQTANAHCNCTLKKIEAKYHSYDEANNKMTTQEVNAIEQQCLQERNGNN